MKCISMISTSNFPELCNRNVLSAEKSGLPKAQSEEFWNGEWSVGQILYDADSRAYLQRANSRKKICYSPLKWSAFLWY